jgi:hypothetical protein
VVRDGQSLRVPVVFMDGKPIVREHRIQAEGRLNDG